MRIRVPGRQLYARAFEPVQTVDPQYNIVDCGLEQADGSIDSIAFGGSFSYLKSLADAANKRADTKDAEAVAAEDSVCVEAEVVAGK